MGVGFRLRFGRQFTLRPAAVLAGAWVLFGPEVASAYVGPGTGLTALGTLFAILGAICFAVIGFVWYPMKRLYSFVRSRFKHGSRRAREN